MIIDCISDLHGYYPELEGGDLLILAGDYTCSDKIHQWAEFFSWLKKQNYRKKVIIGGNHDNFMMNGFPKNEEEAKDLKDVQSFLKEYGEFDSEDFEYLCDSGTEFEGLKIWGSPWTKYFKGMNPHAMAFTLENEDKLNEKWKLIPSDIDILITHIPPYCILDEVPYYKKISENFGSVTLRNRTLNSSYFKKKRLHVFGHIHASGGKSIDLTSCKYVNASLMDEVYDPVFNPLP